MQVVQAIHKKDVIRLAKHWFDVDLTKTQAKIVRNIGYSESRRLVISCMTRYGKSYCVAIGVLLYVLNNENKRILIISPQIDQSRIIRNYLSQFVLMHRLFTTLIDIELTGIERLKSEVSKQRITFRNGCEITILSAEGTGNRLMGHGGDLIILDESCLIDAEVYRQKISRMLGDSPDAALVEIGNPWDRNNQMWEHWTDPAFDKIHVDYKLALKEKRIDKLFLEEQRDKFRTDPIGFKVLYEAQFPEEAEDSIFTYKHVKAATESKIKIDPKTAKKIISCDVADKGRDVTVIMYGYEQDGQYYVHEIYSEAKSENMQIAGKIISIYDEFGADYINIDTIGVGVGVVSRVREVLGEKAHVRACHYGET